MFNLLLTLTFIFSVSCTQGERKWFSESEKTPVGLFGVKIPAEAPTTAEITREPFALLSGLWTNARGQSVWIFTEADHQGRRHRTYLLGHSVAREHSPSSYTFGLNRNPDALELQENYEGDIYARRQIELQNENDSEEYRVVYFLKLLNNSTLEVFWRKQNLTTGEYTDTTDVYVKGNYREQQEKLTAFFNLRKLDGRRIVASIADKNYEKCRSSSRGDNRSRSLRDSIASRALKCAQESIDQGYEPTVADLVQAVRAQYKPMVSLILDNQTYRGPRLMSALRAIATVNRIMTYPDGRVVNFSDEFTDIGRALLAENAEVDLSNDDIALMIEMSAKRLKGLGFLKDLLNALTDAKRTDFLDSDAATELLPKLVMSASEAPYFEGLDMLLYLLNEGAWTPEQITPALEASVSGMNGEAFTMLYPRATKDRASLTALLRESVLGTSRDFNEPHTYQEKLKMIEQLKSANFINSVLSSKKRK